MKPYASLPLATGLAALAVGASVVMAAPEAKALCSSPNPSCATFNPKTSSTPTFANFGTSSAEPEFPFTKARVGFRVTGANEGLPITLSGISITGDGITGSLAFDDITLTANSAAFTSSVFKTIGDVSVWSYANSSMTFTIPSGLNVGATVFGRITYTTAAGDETIFRTSSTTAVPGPLPLLGAASAFGFSRSIRRRIKQAATA